MQRVRLSSHHFDFQDHKLQTCLEPLISGLPDDVALNCLLRLPVEFHPTGKSVCRRWYTLFGNKPQFFTKRKELWFKDPWLYVFTYTKCVHKIQWHVLDLVNLSWHKIARMPWLENVCGSSGFRCVSVHGDRSLLVCGGGASDDEYPVNSVVKYDVVSDVWSVMKKMITPRMYFACGVIGGKVYVAGGDSGDGSDLVSGEVMDPKDGLWQPIASMGTSMAYYDAAVFDGKLFVTEGWFWPFHFVPRGQVYDPETNVWEGMAMGLREGWTGSSVVMFGRLFVVSEHERTKLKVYDSGNDMWEMVHGDPLPEEICKPFVVNGCDDRICVTGKNLCVAVGFVHRLKNDSTDGKVEFGVRWQVVEGPHDCSDMLPLNAQILYA